MLTCGLALAAQPAWAADKTHVIDDSYIRADINWSSALGNVGILWKPLRIDGHLMICGAVTNENSRMSMHNRAILRAGKVEVDKKRVMRNLNFFAILPIGTEPIGAKANCRPIPGEITRDSRIGLQFDGIRVRQ